MNFEDIKDRLLELFNQIRDTLQESPAVNNILERYESLNPNVQKGINLGGIFLAVMIFLSIPYSFISSSSEDIAYFEEDRALISDLLKAGRQSPLPFMRQKRINTTDELKSEVQRVVNSFPLLDDQRQEVEALDLSSEGKPLAPKSILQNGVQAKFKSLNLKEAREFAFRFQSIAPNIKLTGIDIAATAKDNHYFNVIYKVVSFTLPEEEASDSKDNKKKPKR